MLTSITPVQKQDSGGFVKKLTGSAGGIGSIVGGGLGAIVGGPEGAMEGFKTGQSLGGAIGGAAQTAGDLAIKGPSSGMSSSLQNANIDSPDHQMLKLADAKVALNSTNGIPQGDRMTMNQHLDAALDQNAQRRKQQFQQPIG